MKVFIFFLQVAIYSDSQLRPIVQKEYKCPSNFYVNCTPGGRFYHVRRELESSILPFHFSPSAIVFLVGTNDVSCSAPLDSVRSDVCRLTCAARRKFPVSQVTKIPQSENFQVTLFSYLSRCPLIVCHLFSPYISVGKIIPVGKRTITR